MLDFYRIFNEGSIAQAGLVLHLGYVPEKYYTNGNHTNQKKFPFKTVYFLGIRGLTASSYIV